MRVFFVVAMAGIHTGDFECLRDRFDAQKVIIPPPPAAETKIGILARLAVHELVAFPRILRLVLDEPRDVAFVCSTGHYGTLMAMLAARLTGRNTRVYLYNFYLHSLGRQPLVRFVLRHALNESVGVLAWSPEDAEYFTGIAPRSRVDYSPYSDQRVWGVRPEDVRAGTYMFAGGYSNRDYESVIAAARLMPAEEFEIICASANRLPTDLPQNIRILRDVEPTVFYAHLAGSACVVLPLREGVGSSGQMVALAAMQFGKPVIYADFRCVAQYFKDGVSGFAYAPREPLDLVRKLGVVLHDRRGAERAGRAAKRDYEERFAAGASSQQLADYVADFLDGR